MRALTVKGYYKHFLGTYGLAAAALGGFPLLSKLLPEEWGVYLFPPLGNQGPLFRVAALILGALVTFVIYFSKDHQTITSKQGRITALLVAIVVMLVGLIAFFVLSQRFVRSLSIPSKGAEVVVSVGYQRTDFAVKNFGDATDWELLKYRGISEDEIERLWTPKSIIIVRLGLFISYLIFLMSAVASSSLGVLFDKLGPPSPRVRA